MKQKNSRPDYNRSQAKFSLDQIISVCSDVLKIKYEELVYKKSGAENLSRKITIYGCRIWSEEKVPAIAAKFHCKSCSYISDVVREIKQKLKSSRLIAELLNTVLLELINLPKTNL